MLHDVTSVSSIATINNPYSVPGSMRGAFIVFEGIDGTGKTTLCNSVAGKLRESGRDVVTTAEPTHEGIGALIRSGSVKDISQRTESLLFLADRSHHTEQIARWIEEGKVVLCDRYFASTIAYQSSKLKGDGIDRGWLLDASSPFIGVADLTFLLDMDPEVSLHRVGVRGEEISKFEDKALLEQVRSEYLALSEEFGFDVVDASMPAERVADAVMKRIQEVL